MNTPGFGEPGVCNVTLKIITTVFASICINTWYYELLVITTLLYIIVAQSHEKQYFQ